MADTIIPKLAPVIIAGNDATIDASSGKSAVFRSNAAFADFIRVELDSKELVEELNRLFEEEVKKAPGELLELYQLSKEDHPLSDRWNLTYNG